MAEVYNTSIVTVEDRCIEHKFPDVKIKPVEYVSMHIYSKLNLYI